MRILLDTNIIIYREKEAITNKSIGNLYYWLDKTRCSKIIHQLSINELNKYQNIKEKATLDIKLDSYEVMKTIAIPKEDFLKSIEHLTFNDNDIIDDNLLYELHLGKVDAIVTEDKKMQYKASILSLSDKVYSVNSFISKCTAENPTLVSYKALAVKQVYFGNLNINDTFFDSFRNDYEGFNKWFARKCDEQAYVCKGDAEILGFLYLKIEDRNEVYDDIMPKFISKRRLKVGTFKVDSTGFRLGERFIKIIFDNALENNVDEIYITLFKDRPELMQLNDLLLRWGFIEWGKKGRETVLIKQMKTYDDKKDIRANFPNLKQSTRKIIIPIYPKYHTPLFPDSILNNEINFLDNMAYQYALQKVYITTANFVDLRKGDIVLFYRTGIEGNKGYTSVVTTIGILSDVIKNLNCLEDLKKHCQNRSVFNDSDLELFWNNYANKLTVLKFVYLKSLTKRPNLKFLWYNKIIEYPSGPRVGTVINDDQFNTILNESETTINFVKE